MMPMKNFFFAFLAVFLAGCGLFDSQSDGETYAYPLDLSFSLYANDLAKNDSAASNLATGVVMMVHPGASYALSFDADPDFSPPDLELYRLTFKSDSIYLGNRTRKISPEDSLGRWIYRFDCGEEARSYWAATLSNGKDYYAGKVKGLAFSGVGENSLRFSLNLIVVGEYGGTSDSVSLDSLSRLMLAGFRGAFAKNGVSVDTIFVHRASERMDLETAYPDNKPWLAGRSSLDYFLSELGGWPEGFGEPGVFDALDLVLVHRIEMAGVLGYSVFFGGSLGGGEGSTVVVGTHYYLGGMEEYSQSAKTIVETAVHESGHFFGLRHTTSTVSDIEATGDASNVEDGIEDTPYCGKVILAKAAAPEVLAPKPFVAFPRSVLFKTGECPDALNPMFPTASDGTLEPFTAGQLSIFRKNLALYPH